MIENSIQEIANLIGDDYIKYKIRNDPDVRYLLLQLYERIQDLSVIEDINRCMKVEKESSASYAYQYLLHQVKREINGLSYIAYQLIKQYQNKSN